MVKAKDMIPPPEDIQVPEESTEGTAADAILEVTGPAPIALPEDMIHGLIGESEDYEFLRQTVIALWSIIDDIDTYSDMAKGDNVLFREWVERKQKERWTKTGVVTDGIDIYQSKAEGTCDCYGKYGGLHHIDCPDF